MSAEMSVTDARPNLGPITSRAEYGGETIYLTKHGHRAAAIVPAGTAELVEKVEELLDADAVQKALADLESGADVRVPFTRRTSRRSA